MPKSAANAPICEVTISPVVDISVIIANISQKIGLRSMSAVAVLPRRTELAPDAACEAGGDLRPSAARTPTTPKMMP